jgi:TfoX/Sxy family transcriptional regulator of competence genes
MGGSKIMPYNEKIENRIKPIVSKWKDTEAKKMFGGVCHLLNGNMFCGVYKDFLILRLGEKGADEALKLPTVREFDITGRPMKGGSMVDQKGFKSDEELETWLNQAKVFAETLPKK